MVRTPSRLNLKSQCRSVSDTDTSPHAGHSHIDFLRLDVEGWEWETFRGIIRDFTMERVSANPAANANTTGWNVNEREGVLPFGQLQIELHVWNQRFQDFLEWWELLEVSGLRPFHHEVRSVVVMGRSCS